MTAPLSHLATLLGRSMQKELNGEWDASIDVDRGLLEKAGIPLNSLDYCDWLFAFRLRQHYVMKDRVRFVCMP